MDEKILAYRKKHKRCKYCKYYKYYSVGISGIYYKCNLKNKIFSEHNLKGCFCKWYEPKEG